MRAPDLLDRADLLQVVRHFIRQTLSERGARVWRMTIDPLVDSTESNQVEVIAPVNVAALDPALLDEVVNTAALVIVRFAVTRNARDIQLEYSTGVDSTQDLVN